MAFQQSSFYYEKLADGQPSRRPVDATTPARPFMEAFFLPSGRSRYIGLPESGLNGFLKESIGVSSDRLNKACAIVENL